MTVAESVERWLYQYKRNSVKPSTFDRLETSFTLMTKYRIASIELADLKAGDIQAYLNDLVADGYALSTIKKQFNLLSAYLDWANIEGIVLRPIQRNIKMPSQSVVRKPKRDIEVYSRQEQRKLSNVLSTRAYPAYAAASLMMETGMRVGEVLALNWDDIDWTRRAVRIDKTMVRLGNRHRSFIQNEAKSYSSNRTAPLNRAAMSLLNELYSEATDEHGFVISDAQGKPLTYDAVRYQIQQACKKAGVEYKGQHVFRHTFATNCFYRGCNVKLLSKLLGHADVSVTYNTYVHLFGDALEEMRNVVE